ncbi:TPA: bifunctional diaminohydroxyphosphoribosylaminopyrimidine deaminase/5-amino-6-(5-phosphoribosylamino)uracil reductase RibD [Corynebacterium striatum]|nr:bifunctional diaminohydroxyphosphoribosylaminopyrimidine deaminase/5-amino-6-(5-phosphoribosylamino)uracil reductase RibD [Corynebacterium striatum]
MKLDLDAALIRAMEAGQSVRGTTSPNPPVGAVILDAEGNLVGTGATQPVGGPHAEVMALQEAGSSARGGIAVVTLEPCNHTGRTGPCAEALIAADISQVYFLHPDPNDVAAGGAQTLRAAGIEVAQIEAPAELPVSDALIPWLTSLRLGRPHVTLKFAQTLDGFTSASDGTSQWITGEHAREWVHVDRARRDAIIIGTGTALADNPSLTARFPDGTLREQQPRRLVIGQRNLEDAGAASSHLRELGYDQFANIDDALISLYEAGARDVLVEGGAGLASAFLNAGYVDAVQAYIAPLLLGEGRGVLAHPVAQTLQDAWRFQRVGTTVLGDDVLIEYVRSPYVDGE